MKIYESAENYLERILMIKDEKGTVYSIDIANSMSVSKPSVSVAMKKLKEGGLVEMAEDNAITLTPEGMKIARNVYARHIFFTQWLVSLGVDLEVAKEDACRLEHGLSDESFDAFKRRAKDDLKNCDVCKKLIYY